MKFRVYVLRHAGRRLCWRAVHNGPAHVGHLVSHAVDLGGERYTVLSLRPADPVQSPGIADLYEPVLVGFSVLALRVRGFERLEGAAGAYSVVQEWHCELP
ncbi:MAG TPA: hypothetical protein VHG88_17280 [Burkholderiales bacterium]|nr:hypothetical protein [Burkholderiales bacterium]